MLEILEARTLLASEDLATYETEIFIEESEKGFFQEPVTFAVWGAASASVLGASILWIPSIRDALHIEVETPIKENGKQLNRWMLECMVAGVGAAGGTALGTASYYLDKWIDNTDLEDKERRALELIIIERYAIKGYHALALPTFLFAAAKYCLSGQPSAVLVEPEEYLYQQRIHNPKTFAHIFSYTQTAGAIGLVGGALLPSIWKGIVESIDKEEEDSDRTCRVMPPFMHFELVLAPATVCATALALPLLRDNPQYTAWQSAQIASIAYITLLDVVKVMGINPLNMGASIFDFNYYTCDLAHEENLLEPMPNNPLISFTETGVIAGAVFGTAATGIPYLFNKFCTPEQTYPAVRFLTNAAVTAAVFGAVGVATGLNLHLLHAEYADEVLEKGAHVDATLEKDVENWSYLENIGIHGLAAGLATGATLHFKGAIKSGNCVSNSLMLAGIGGIGGWLVKQSAEIGYNLSINIFTAIWEAGEYYWSPRHWGEGIGTLAGKMVTGLLILPFLQNKVNEFGEFDNFYIKAALNALNKVFYSWRLWELVISDVWESSNGSSSIPNFGEVGGKFVGKGADKLISRLINSQIPPSADPILTGNDN